jgi:hypothetical protein
MNTNNAYIHDLSKSKYVKFMKSLRHPLSVVVSTRKRDFHGGDVSSRVLVGGDAV